MVVHISLQHGPLSSQSVIVVFANIWFNLAPSHLEDCSVSTEHCRARQSSAENFVDGGAQRVPGHGKIRCSPKEEPLLDSSRLPSWSRDDLLGWLLAFVMPGVAGVCRGSEFRELLGSRKRGGTLLLHLNMFILSMLTMSILGIVRARVARRPGFPGLSQFFRTLQCPVPGA